MASQWMPQNIQKRLLIYVLDQLSLFSGIDLQNVDVSLGSQSSITLNDVELDTEALKIPGLFLRNGQIKNLKLDLNVSGGVSIDGDGISLTIALSSTSPSDLGADLEKSKFSLQQSTMDLAQSILQLDEDLDQEQDEDFKTPSQSIHSSFVEGKQPSKLNSVMQKAVEAALSRLQINLRNISLKVILDHATVECEVSSTSFSTLNGTRTLKSSDIMIISIKPHGFAGENGDLETQESENDDTVESSSDEDDEGKYSDMTSSSVLQRPQREENDLTTSLVYSKEEASSIYMSANSDVFQETAKELRDSPKLIYIDKAEIRFTGLSKIENLQIQVGKVNVAVNPIPLTVLHLIESLVSLNAKHNYSLISRNPASKLRGGPIKPASAQTKNKDENDETAFLFEHFTVDEINFNFVSALLSNGNFSVPKELTLSLKSFELKCKNQSLVFGSLKSLVIIENDKILGFFENDEIKSDIRFEIQLVERNVTILLPKNFEVNLHQKNINKVLKVFGYLQQILDSSKRFQTSKLAPVRPQNDQYFVTLQTSVIFINIATISSNLRIKVSPISYVSKQNLLLVNSILIQNGNSKLVTLSNLQIKAEPQEKQIKSFDNQCHEIILTSSNFIKIETIAVTHGWTQLRELMTELKNFLNELSVPDEDIVFKSRKKTRISNNLMFQSRQSMKLVLDIDQVFFDVLSINDGFGDLKSSFKKFSILVNKDNLIQMHIFHPRINRVMRKTVEPAFEIINQEEKNIPSISLRTKDFKKIDANLKNVILEYYTNWLPLFENSCEKNGSISFDSESDKSESPSEIELKFQLIDIAIGLNPGRLSSKANLVIGSGSFDLLLAEFTSVKSQLKSCNLVLVDSLNNIYEDEKIATNRVWSSIDYYIAKNYTNVAQLKTLALTGIIKSSNQTTSTVLDIHSDKLEVELCADSNQCLMSLFNDLKLPVSINPEDKYRVERPSDVDVFHDVDEFAFDGRNTEYITKNIPITITDLKSADKNLESKLLGNNAPIDIVEEYIVNSKDGENILETDLLSQSEVTIKGPWEDSLTPTVGNMETTTYFSGVNHNPKLLLSMKDENSDSSIEFNNEHFEEDNIISKVKQTNKPSQYPLVLNLTADKINIKIYDGYDWKHTRKTISRAVKILKEKLSERRDNKPPYLSSNNSKSENNSKKSRNLEDEIIGETLFDSIHVSFPTSKDPEMLNQVINNGIQNTKNNRNEVFGIEDQNSLDGIDVGKKNNIKKLKLSRSKYHKILIEISDLIGNFTIYLNQDALTYTETSQAEESEVVNELDLNIANFEITDNVPTSTWNKFVTYMKDIEREVGSSMLQLNMKTVRAAENFAATELVLDVNILPLRLHVDQDTLELLTRFAEFKDSRFLLIDEYEDIPYIEKFSINAIQVRLDYKPKTIDYSGLRSGRTTEFMNFFILDEADMVLKQVTLYGISGFPKLGVLLNGIWMPDIKSTQLSGVLAGLAPVRSVVNIGSGLKDLVLIPVQEYKKDGRIYRSFSKGVEHFTRNTTNELLKFGVKLAAGTQTLLENTEQALGGVGSSGRVTSKTDEILLDDDNDLDDDYDYDYETKRTNHTAHASQLIGRSSLSVTNGGSSSLYRSIYQPTLESIADIKQIESFRRDKMSKKFNDNDSDSDVDPNPSSDDELPKNISLYANQPINLKEGLQLAYDSLGRNFLVAKEAMIKAGQDISESSSAHDTGLIIAKAAPIALIRPIIGATEATSRALLGINNQFDPEQWKYVEDKYKQTKK
ncbi:hypothetical protein WICMUC_002943 [Wickerhamomyces mucosus]|uniref:Autophagy-related protein 2 n=1 Tax=Wickerhamomyces mucosus TaxID=1378264 RepID=A0A9P8PMB8_9ASCO|nr:hypothetical protein WICMUC_002943 [Wickerhamomyces mucosus]